MGWRTNSGRTKSISTLHPLLNQDRKNHHLPTSQPPKNKVKVKLRDGKEREIQHMISTSFWSADGKPISAEEFLNNLFGSLPSFFKSEEELRTIWSNPMTRKTLTCKIVGCWLWKRRTHNFTKAD